jgi:alpha-glucosidase
MTYGLRRAHHDGSGLYVDNPSPALGERVTVRVRVPAGARVDRVHVRSHPDGEPHFDAAVIDRVGREETWWRVEVTARNPVTGYRFLLAGPGGYRWLNALGEFGHDVPDVHDFRLVTHEPPPAWAADAVVYQIFPDRYARSAAAAGRPAPDWALACDWDTPVVGRGPQTPFQLYGGDLDGIAERLDHVEALGANTVYLTPVFPAGSSHRYDAASFDHVDPLLGGDAALRRLADALHARGMRLLGDVTTNHCGAGHPWFRAALEDPTAPERDMFFIEPDGSYASWLGVPSLPTFNWASPLLRDRFLDGPDAVLPRWLDVLDGWRVDVANMTGRRGSTDLTWEVAAAVRQAAVKARPDALLLAEHAHDASADLDRGGWHGTMNYAGFVRPVWTWLAGAFTPPDFLGVPADLPRRGGPDVVATMRAFSALVSWQAWTTSWTMLSSHDSPRIRTVVGSADLVRVALALQMTLPGTPMVFAGDEIGMTGRWGEDGRRPMPWHRPETWDTATLASYRELVALRRATPALRHGGLRWAYVGDDALVAVRETADQSVVVLVRRAAGEPVRVAGLPAADNVLGGAPALRPGVDGTVELPGDGPDVQVWLRGS